MLSKAHKAAVSINEAIYCDSADIDLVDATMRKYLTDDEYLAAWATVFVRREESLYADIRQIQEAQHGQSDTVPRCGWSVLASHRGA